MKKSTKFSDILHVLLHMEQSTNPMTSEKLAEVMCTNPVVVRRTMAGLREQGFVRSEKGHGGGWILSSNLKKVTLLDVYKAIESPTLLAVTNRHQNPGCLVEQAVNTATGKVFDEAESLLLNKFKSVTLAEVKNHIKRNSKHTHGK